MEGVTGSEGDDIEGEIVKGETGKRKDKGTEGERDTVEDGEA